MTNPSFSSTPTDQYSRFLAACRREPVDAIPVWYMRQAGRYQPEYRKIREKYSLLEICRTPELCVQISQLPVTQLGVDAAILFSDIMVPLSAMGVELDIQENVGPLIAHPLRSDADVQTLHAFETVESLPYVLDSIRQLKHSLSVPLIGFAGGPYTLASYLIEGQASRSYLHTKQMMWNRPDLWQTLMDKLGAAISHFLRAQIQAGAAAVQIFDSWVGSLSPEDFQTYVLPTMKRVFHLLQDTGVPIIYFGVNTGDLLPAFAESGASVIGVDWRTPLQEARRRIGPNQAIQGNLDPAMLLAPWSVLSSRAEDIVTQGVQQPGFIFNLGHGVVHHHPPVSVDVLRRLTQHIHEYSHQCLVERGNLV
ncbi:uroporphyrinogen decarboxylase [Alicyclobacillaceae bacterium I2511]|nr:uroporphyrinogen decarboxylase [Alicyclobacillaceae bacterium I2511]